MKKWKLALAGVLAVVLYLPACSSVPAFEDVRAQHPDVGEATRLMGPRGPLSAEESARILERLKREAPNADILTRHLVFEEAVAGTPLTAGNKVTLLKDGQQTFDAMWGAMSRARNHINLEFFIFEDVEHRGKSVVDLLLEKQKAGAQVNVIYDSIGSQDTSGEVFQRLRDGGVRVLEFNPMNPLKSEKPRLYSPNDRDHRKILVVDGRIGITGGINISNTYSSSGSRDKKEKQEDQRPWRDSDVMIEGPAVAEFQRLFLDTWKKQGGDPLPERTYFPKIEAKGDEVVRVIGSTPRRDPPAFYVTLVSAIRTAEHRIWITNSYFAPTDETIEELVSASKRGVDVRLVLQGESDAPKVQINARATYAKLLKAGIKIYERQEAILHAKTAAIDGVWSAIGSSNIDFRSVVFNDEVDAIVLGRETAAELEKHFEEDVRASKEITTEAWAQRPLWDRIKEFFSRFWEPLM